MASDDIPEEEIKNLQVEDDAETPGYKAPAQKALSEIQALDADDESLNKYKEQLLGKAGDVKDEGGHNVLVKTLVLRVEGRDDVVLDLTGDLKELKIAVKEGITFRLVVGFRVQREIVAGLRFKYNILRKGIKIISSSQMVGSYAPQSDAYAFVCPPEEIASGMLYRGTYNIKCLFTDDDKYEYLKWEFKLIVDKSWPK